MNARSGKSSCCGAKTKVDPRWDCCYCPACGAWLEPLCECTRQDFDRGDCHVDKWSGERPVRHTMEPAYAHAREVVNLSDWSMALAMLAVCIIILILGLMAHGLIFPSICLTVLYVIVVWVRRRCERERQKHLAMLDKETTDGG